MVSIELNARVGPDGILHLKVPLTPADANSEVLVSVRPAATTSKLLDAESWQKFVHRTAGSIADPTFRRPTQGEFELRDGLP